MWTAWILASAVFLALYDLAKKASVKGNAVLPVLLVSSFCGMVAYVGALGASGHLAETVQATTARTVALASIKTLIVSTSWVLTYCALRTLPITIATPIRASAPALVLLAAVFLYDERPTTMQGAGMALVFGGYWAFSWAGRHEGIDFRRNRAVWCAVGGMCFSAASSLWDKYIFQVQDVPVEQMQLWFQLGLVAVYALLFAANRVARVDRVPFAWRWSIPSVGVLLALADWLYFRGLAIPDVPISVGSLMRRFSVVITFVLGARFFHETNLRRKGMALAAIVAGIALMAVG
ncbi:MAG: DMT family transporter [Kiritimatiellae bacterium]|nr:DMT family transporter [Kiritimatiellia bacterium]